MERKAESGRSKEWFLGHSKAEWYADGGRDPLGRTAKQLKDMFEHWIEQIICQRYADFRIRAYPRTAAIQETSKEVRDFKPLYEEFVLTRHFPEKDRPDSHLYPPSADRVAVVLDRSNRERAPHDLLDKLVRHVSAFGHCRKPVSGLGNDNYLAKLAWEYFQAARIPLLSEDVYDQLERAYQTGLESKERRTRRSRTL